MTQDERHPLLQRRDELRRLLRLQREREGTPDDLSDEIDDMTLRLARDVVNAVRAWAILAEDNLRTGGWDTWRMTYARTALMTIVPTLVGGLEVGDE